MENYEERIEALEPEVIEAIDECAEFVENDKFDYVEKGLAAVAGAIICAGCMFAYKKVVKFINDKKSKSEEPNVISEESSKDISEEQKTK